MVRVVSYNIHGGVGNDGAYDLARIAGTLRRSGCDIACLQQVEINFEQMQQRKWSSMHQDNQVEQLASLTGLSFYSFVGPLSAHTGSAEDRPVSDGWHCSPASEEILVCDTQGKVGGGNAVLSRFPILDSQYLVFEQSKAPISDEHIYMEREQQPRAARAILVDTQGAHEDCDSLSQAGDSTSGREAAKTAVARRVGMPPLLACCAGAQREEVVMMKEADSVSEPVAPLWIVTTHLSHRCSTEEQREQARQLIDFVGGLTKESPGTVKPGVVLCGDLNAPPLIPWSAYSVLTADGRLKDAWNEGGKGFHKATYPSCCGPSVGLPLDYIFLLSHPEAAKVQCTCIRVLSSSQDLDGSDHCAVCADLEL